MAGAAIADARAAIWLKRTVSETAKLPPPILKVLAALGRGDLGYDQLRPVLDASDGLRRRLLAIANSPFYSPVTPIEDVSHAAVSIGQRQLIGMTLAQGVHRALRTGAACHGHDHNGLLTHCLATGATAWAIADECEVPPDVGGMLYVAGMFHDLGKALIGRRFGDLDLWSTPADAPGLAALEQERLGIDHVEASVRLAEHWGLHPRVVEVIADHHAPGGQDRAGAILHLADHLVGAHGVGFVDDLPPETPPDPESICVFADDPELIIRAKQHALKESARAVTTLELLL